jgi:hypothetical protein
MKPKKYRKWTCVFVGVLFLGTMMVSAEYRRNETEKVDMLYDYEILWSREWSDGYKSGGMRNAINSLNDIVVCGVRNNEFGVILEWKENGDFSWKENVTSYEKKADMPSGVKLGDKKKPVDMTTEDIEQFKQQILGENHPRLFPLMDVAIDSENNIVSVGVLYEDNLTKQTIGVVKYSPDGYQIWNKTYKILPFKMCSTISMGLSVDSNDYIYIAGTLINEKPPFLTFQGLIIKLSPEGKPIWIKTTRILKPTVYVDVDVDSDDNVFASGFLLSLLTKETKSIVTKYDKNNGRKLNEAIIDFENDSMLTSIKIDREDDSIYIVGGAGPKLTGFMTKLDANLNVVWVVWGDRGCSLFTDAAVMKNGKDIVLSGVFGTNNYSAAVYDKHTGIEKLVMDLGPRIGGGYWGLDDYMKGVSVDSNGDIIVTGARGAVKVIKVRVTEGGEGLINDTYNISSNNNKLNQKQHFSELISKILKHMETKTICVRLRLFTKTFLERKI